MGVRDEMIEATLARLECQRIVDARWRAAIWACRADGLGIGEIARLARVSRQAIYDVLASGAEASSAN